MATAPCLDCGREVDLGPDPFEGQRVVCVMCGANLELISLQPCELDWVYDEDVLYEEYDDADDVWERELEEY
jgi:lysine biosynthesis protein LysW